MAQKYFQYEFPKIPVVMIGTEKEEIIDTIIYYKTTHEGDGALVVPSASDIFEISGLELECCFPMCIPKHSIRAEVRPNIVLVVNANAFDHVVGMGRDYECLRRGRLYEFGTGLPYKFRRWFLPEFIMQGIIDYDWLKHSSQVDQWNGNLDGAWSNLERENLMVRTKRVS